MIIIVLINHIFHNLNRYKNPKARSIIKNNTNSISQTQYHYETENDNLPIKKYVLFLQTGDNKGWTTDNENVVRYYINFLSYMCLIYHFYYFKLKNIENWLGVELLLLFLRYHHH